MILTGRAMPRTCLAVIAIAAMYGVFSQVPSDAFNEVVTKDVFYEEAGVRLKGHMARDPGFRGKRPGILIVHQWKGLGDYEKYRARLLAEMGYVAFAVDVYGIDSQPVTNHEASLAVATFRNDRGLYRRRLLSALEVLRKEEGVDPERIAAIGYCFGGTGVLELARSGANICAVVSFHGGLSNPDTASNDSITAVVQVHHAALDQSVLPDEVQAFGKEMNASGAPWDLHVYGGAVHGFTEKGPRYNERADRLSWRAMKELFRELFEKEQP